MLAAQACWLLASAAFAGISFVPGEPLNIPTPDVVLVGDLNNDNRADVVVLSSVSREIASYLGADTPSRLTPAHALRVGQSPVGAVLGDLNGDGRLDLVVADSAAGRVFLLLGRGDGFFLCPIEVAVPDSRRAVAVAVGNFDDAGNLDIAVADDRRGRVFVLRNDNATPPGFLRGGDLDVGEAPRDLRSIDLNGDGKLDLLTVNVGGPPTKEVAAFIWRRAVEGFPEFFPAQRFIVGERPEQGQLTVADFNNDGSEDVAILSRARANDGNSQIQVLLGRSDGVLLPPLPFPVACPFFTAGAPCRSLGLASGDVQNDGSFDLIVSLTDPRSASSPADAMQILAGRDGSAFAWGPVFGTQEKPGAVAVADVTGDDSVDIVVANRGTLDLQVFLNTSSPGSVLLGDPCLLGEECISDRCVNGVCCAFECAQNMICNIPGREGTCSHVPATPTECGRAGAGAPECDPAEFCVDGFCCDQECNDGRCNIEGLFGVCIERMEAGAACGGNDEECISGHCGDNFICCREECDAGRCQPDTGICRPLLPQAEPCREDDECLSGVCDLFEGICCNRVCDPDDESCAAGEGVCRSFYYTSAAVAAPPTTPGPGPCDVPNSPSATPTGLPTLPTPDPCSACPPGRCIVGLGCESPTRSSGGCSVGHASGAVGWSAVALLLFAPWARRRASRRRAPPHDN